ncbi:hypothetical protein Pla22_28940 [Rubripirellula amarantea]|uniref:Uncharacterized protein n=1 Tax=Rubripirellula amarantea TaxID=2527999 RepID=A0A5C5WH77_9BACT|nr:hypothetical protein Pla22_28940 [Rubripirellula amarantea]
MAGEHGHIATDPALDHIVTGSTSDNVVHVFRKDLDHVRIRQHFGSVAPGAVRVQDQSVFVLSTIRVTGYEVFVTDWCSIVPYESVLVSRVAGTQPYRCSTGQRLHVSVFRCGADLHQTSRLPEHAERFGSFFGAVPIGGASDKLVELASRFVVNERRIRGQHIGDRRVIGVDHVVAITTIDLVVSASCIDRVVDDRSAVRHSISVTTIDRVPAACAGDDAIIISVG